MGSPTWSSGLVVVVGPSLDSQGGIASVNRTLQSIGFFGAGDDGLDVRFHASTRDGSIPGRALYAVVRFARFAIAPRRKPWAVHAHLAFQGSFWRKAAYGWVTRLRGGRVIYHVHPNAFWDYYERGGPVRRAAIRGTLARADALVAITRRMQELLARIVPSRPRFFVSNPVDLRKVPAPIVRDAATIAFVGWLVPSKGVFELVDAIARLRSRVPGLRLVFAGSKDDGALRARVSSSGVADVVSFVGWLPADDVRSLLNRATVLALPSYNEGSPMAILEALACGTPIVATAVGGIPEILQHERNALLVPPRDAGALAGALERVVSDPELRRRMSEANRDAARAFDAESSAASLRAIYRRVLGAGEPGT